MAVAVMNICHELLKVNRSTIEDKYNNSMFIYKRAKLPGH